MHRPGAATWLGPLPARVPSNACRWGTLEHAKRYSRGFAIVYVDLDGFKTVNDTMGHAAGDAVLVDVAPRRV